MDITREENPDLFDLLRSEERLTKEVNRLEKQLLDLAGDLRMVRENISLACEHKKAQKEVGGYSCELCGTYFESLTGLNKARRSKLQQPTFLSAEGEDRGC
jgi:hypothetical protein